MTPSLEVRRLFELEKWLRPSPVDFIAPLFMVNPYLKLNWGGPFPHARGLLNRQPSQGLGTPWATHQLCACFVHTCGCSRTLCRGGSGYDTPQWGSVAGDGFLQVRRGSRGEIWVPETTE